MTMITANCLVRQKEGKDFTEGLLNTFEGGDRRTAKDGHPSSLFILLWFGPVVVFVPGGEEGA